MYLAINTISAIATVGGRTVKFDIALCHALGGGVAAVFRKQVHMCLVRSTAHKQQVHRRMWEIDSANYSGGHLGRSGQLRQKNTKDARAVAI